MSKVLNSIEKAKNKKIKRVHKKDENSPRQKRVNPKGIIGKPIKELDKDTLFKLAQTMLPIESIATIMGCSKDLISSRYSDILQAGRDDRRHSLVQVMWHQALYEKDTKMMIWLSKQHLNYKDVIVEESTQIVFNVVTNEVPE